MGYTRVKLLVMLMFTVLSITAPLQIANVTNMKNDSSHTGSFKMNDNISNDYTYYCHQFKQVSYSSIFVYTAIKRRLLVEAGTETNPGPISNALHIMLQEIKMTESSSISTVKMDLFLSTSLS